MERHDTALTGHASHRLLYEEVERRAATDVDQIDSMLK